MDDPPKYHTPEQQANALLGPIHAALRELEGRAGHYLERIRLAEPDRERVRAAHEVLATARAAVGRLRTEGARGAGAERRGWG